MHLQPYNHLQFPTDIVLLVMQWRLRYKLSLRDLARYPLGDISGEDSNQSRKPYAINAVRDRGQRFALLITEKSCRNRRGKGGGPGIILVS